MATHKKSSGNQPELTASIVKALIDEGIKHGQASMGFGGLWEPLLSNDLTELIAYGRKKGLIEAMFNTNGLLLNDRLAEDLIDSGLTRIMISLDAVTAKTYKLMRPGSDLAQVEQNILTLLDKRKRAKSRLPLVRLSFCLTKINQSELLPFLERWNNVVDFFSVQTYGRFDDTSPLLFPNSSPMTLPTGHCAQPFKRLLVRHNGDVLPCCDLSGLSLTLGQAVHGLAQIWSSSKLFDLRASLKSPNFTDLPVACQSCQTKYLAPV
jgi:radical SAM protein with 4Fe4S-binding SPASM domain